MGDDLVVLYNATLLPAGKLLATIKVLQWHPAITKVFVYIAGSSL